MSELEPDDDEKPQRDFGTDPGDLGVIAIALVFTFAFLMLMFGPSPVAKYEQMKSDYAKQQAQAAKVARKKAIDKAVATGEVDIAISPIAH